MGARCLIRTGLVGCILLCSVAAALGQDRFSAAFPKTVFEQWLAKAEARPAGDDEVRRVALIGRSVVRTYATSQGERKLELQLTHSGDIYDVGEFLDLGPQADAYISSSAQTVAGRLIWALLTRNEPYLRSVVASSYLAVETPFLGGKEDQVVQFMKELPDLDVGNFYLTYDQGKPILASDVRETSLRIYITPTLDLLLHGQSTLYRDDIVAQLKGGASEDPAAPVVVNPAYGLRDGGNQFSYALPEIGYYRNARSFTRRSPQSPWVSTSREQLAIPEGRIASMVANRWATLALSPAYRYKDMTMAENYQIDMAVEGAALERFVMSGPQAIDWLGTVVGRGLPAYYNTISAKREGEQVHVRGQWMVRDPDLAYEHVLRITDIFRVTSDEQYVWQRSEIRMVLAVRTDHIEQWKAPTPATTGTPPIFRVRLNR